MAQTPYRFGELALAECSNAVPDQSQPASSGSVIRIPVAGVVFGDIRLHVSDVVGAGQGRSREVGRIAEGLVAHGGYVTPLALKSPSGVGNGPTAKTAVVARAVIAKIPENDQKEREIS